MDNLNKSGEKIPQIDEANPITLLKNPDKFKDSFFEMTGLASQFLKSQDYEKALKVLSKSLDMLDLGKNILKDLSKYWKLCIFANFACAYQGTWKMQKCHKYCEKIEQELEKHLQTVACKQHYLNLTKHLIRIKFQHCAILSQLNQHDKALQMCKSTLPTLQNYIKSILEYTQSLMANHADKKSSQIVHFSKQVCSLAQEILKNLLKCLDEPIELNKQKSSFYYWQKNPQNNEEQVKRKYVTNKTVDNCKRSILGVNKIAHWIDEFNIGTIMHMSQLTINDFQQTLPIEEYIFKDKLYETVIHCSVAHFTIATQMRFIESGKDKEKGQSQIKQPEKQKQQFNLNVIQKKYGYEQKSQLFKLSELYHLRAINIMSQNIKTTVPYISHLIKSYDKHYIYKKQLEPILAIIQESAISVSQANLMRQKQSKANMDDEDNYFKYSSGYREEQQNYQNSENIQILDQLQGELPRQTVRESRRVEESQQDSNMVPTYIVGESRNLSHGQKRHKSMGRMKPKVSQQQPNKTKQPKTKRTGKKKKERGEITGEKQVRIKHESCTQIKLVFKKKK